MVHLRGLLEAKDRKDERISAQRTLMPCPNPGPNPSWRPGTWEVVVLFVSSVDGLFLTPKQFSYTVNPNLPKQGPPTSLCEEESLHFPHCVQDHRKGRKEEMECLARTGI